MRTESLISSSAKAAGYGSGLMRILGQFLDSNRVGSVRDNVMGMASKLFPK